jgi:eukaryotic-like serine/threonine-protein kinase
LKDPERVRSALEEATTARLSSDPPPGPDAPAINKDAAGKDAAKDAADKDAPQPEAAVRPVPGKRPNSDRPPPLPPRASAAAGDLPPRPSRTVTTSDAIGRTLDGRYRIEERLGVGGVGAVYLGTQLALGRSVAIKLLHEGLDPSFRTRFEREAKALAALRHPNIVSVTDYGVDDTIPYLVMEKLEGETLGERLARGPLLPEHVLELTRQLLRALGFVHEQGLVHRDLKPGNLFLELTPDGDERLKLLDFGLAKFVQEPGIEGQTVTRAGHVVGTPAYMAPEQIAGDAVDARSDIYAVGVLLFQSLSGKVPFEGEPMEQLKGHLVAPVPPLVVAQTERVPRAELSALVARALEKRRDARYDSALDMLIALESIPQPWLVDPALVEAAEQSDPEKAKTVVHQGSAKRHAAVQKKDKKKDSTRPGRMRLVLVLLLGALALYAVQRLNKPARELLRSAGKAPTAVPADPTAEAEGKGGDMDMVIALPEAAETAAGTGSAPAADPVGAEPPATEAAVADPAAVAELGEGEGANAEPAEIHDDEAAAQVAARPPTPPGPPAGWRNPWTRDTPAALRTIRKAVMEGERGNDRMIATLRKYNRNAGNRDPRGHLLLARMYLNRGWRQDALNQFTIVYHIDQASRGAPKMLSDVLTLVAYGKTYRNASRFVREAYGAEAAREIDRMLALYKADPAAVARLKALRAAIGGA